MKKYTNNKKLTPPTYRKNPVCVIFVREQELLFCPLPVLFLLPNLHITCVASLHTSMFSFHAHRQQVTVSNILPLDRSRAFDSQNRMTALLSTAQVRINVTELSVRSFTQLSRLVELKVYK